MITILLLLLLLLLLLVLLFCLSVHKRDFSCHSLIYPVVIKLQMDCILTLFSLLVYSTSR